MSLADWPPCVTQCLAGQSVYPQTDPAFECCWSCGLLASDPQFPTCMDYFKTLENSMAKEGFMTRQSMSSGSKIAIGLGIAALILVIIFMLVRAGGSR